MVAVKSMCCTRGVAMIDKMGCKSEKYEVSNTTPPLDSADSKHPVVLAFDVYNMADTGGGIKDLELD